MTRTGSILLRSKDFTGGVIVTHCVRSGLRIPVRHISCVSISPGRMITITATYVPFLRGSSSGHTLVNTGVRHRTIPLVGPRTPFINAKVRCGTTRSSNTTLLYRGSNIIRCISTGRVHIHHSGNTLSGCRVVGFRHSGSKAYCGRHPVMTLNSHISINRALTSNPSVRGNRVTLKRGILITFVA